MIAGLAAWGWWATRPKPVDGGVVKVERGTVDHQVLDDGERFGTKRFDRDGVAVAVAAHADLAGGAGHRKP